MSPDLPQSDTQLLADIRTMIARYGRSNETLAAIITCYILARQFGTEDRLRAVWAQPADDVFISADTFDAVVS